MLDEYLERWFNAAYALKVTNFGEGRNLESQREDERYARQQVVEAINDVIDLRAGCTE